LRAIQELTMISKMILMAAVAALTVGCNTMRGVGQDIEAGGDKVEDVLKKDKSNTDTAPSTTSPDVTTNPEPASEDTGRSSESMSPSGPEATQ
jgi:predicted small secreted protein